MKFKPGDKVRLVSLVGSDYLSLKEGDILTVKKIEDYGCYVFIETNYHLHGSRLELVERPFTKEDVEIGMWVQFSGFYIYPIERDEEIEMVKSSEKLSVIYKPDDNGNLIKIWEREEPKFTVQCPFTQQYLVSWEQGTYKWHDKVVNTYTHAEVEEIKENEHAKEFIVVGV